MSSQRILITTVAPDIKFRCTLCGWCCRNYTPLVTAEDARRIQERLRKPLSSFVVFYRLEDFTVPLVDDERIFLTRHGPLVMGLARQEDACVFLKDNLCSIHTFKPGICQAFPFQPVEPGDVQGPFVLLDDPCDGRNASDEVVAQESARHSYEGFIYDYHEYVELVKTWNEAPSSRDKDIEDFLQYVGLDWWRYKAPPRRKHPPIQRKEVMG
ncbi:MAG: YkgJ family cysteine cluster protein [Chloroflexi bacterium]|nr:YkgJ family cysteine cluster protein [Chloroflexota bacterium]